MFTSYSSSTRQCDANCFSKRKLTYNFLHFVKRVNVDLILGLVLVKNQIESVLGIFIFALYITPNIQKSWPVNA